mgnify:CR=1 FL=1
MQHIMFEKKGWGKDHKVSENIQNETKKYNQTSEYIYIYIYSVEMERLTSSA